jgi:hypothetical protein
MEKEIKLAWKLTKWVFIGSRVMTRWVARQLVRLVGTWVLLGRDTLPCPTCHADVPLYGSFYCQWCEKKFLGHAFAPCPTRGCGAVPGWIPCPRCEHGVDNPAYYGP